MSPVYTVGEGPGERLKRFIFPKLINGGKTTRWQKRSYNISGAVTLLCHSERKRRISFYRYPEMLR